MSKLKDYITIKAIILLLVAVIFTPTAIKFIHVFEHHEHKVCIDGKSEHIHKVDLDCEFQKFQLNNHFLSIGKFVYLINYNWNDKISFLTYKFLNNHRHLSFSLRGPPVLV
ncbi:hypothetical protein [Seonamhaeicola aphaedonensis]|uniref:Uncharacterized protein n=1 Tax=Seonamhaeicola aphaedonensis TaxID=1461338 RepID=A0A3D9H8N8_9FLAO|nr:hypothetical protein [Seonamhaeicola aphaedonensis]RED45864.1 hypothetical protein DFQ02_1079 [Seonamhaeicola aphaedonensis]